MNTQYKNIHHEENESVTMRILIVDDDQDILDSLKDILELEIENCVVETVNSVEKAKHHAEQMKPDIVLLDIKIGQDNGLDLIPELKLISQDIVCIMMTAFRDNEYTITAVRFGANDYLFKPIKPLEMIQTVTRLFKEQSIKRKIEFAEKRLFTIFEQATQWLFLLDNDGKLIDANKLAMDFIDAEKEDIIGKEFSQSPWYIFSIEAQKSIQNGLKHINTGEIYHTEIIILDKEKNNKFFDLYMKPVVKSGNKVEQVIVESRDITDRKNAENEIKALNSTLELRVHERTLELEQSLVLLEEENKERKKAEEEAYKASEAKSDFLSRMSHELRTPMNAILGFAQLLQLDSDNLDENQDASVQEIMKAGEHLLSLVDEVLDLTAIETGNLDVTLNDINLDEVIKQCTSLIQPLVNARQIKLIDNLRDKGYVLHADFIRLKQVLLNLLSNAVKYNSENGTIIIDAEVINKSRLRINITDTGEGLSKADIAKLFIPFERLNTRFNVEGVGIGLVISKNIVELMGGNIGVTSTVGKGSTFYIELNFANVKTDTNLELSLAKNKVILCIDDNELNLELIENIFNQESTYTLISTTEVFKGIKIAEEQQPDIILMDINMPEMNGYEALDVLQKNKTTHDIPVIAVTGNATKDDIENGQTAGFKRFITKPFRIKELLDAIDDILLVSKSVV